MFSSKDRTYAVSAVISGAPSFFLNDGISSLPFVMILMPRASSRFQSDVKSVAPARFPLAVLLV